MKHDDLTTYDKWLAREWERHEKSRKLAEQIKAARSPSTANPSCSLRRHEPKKSTIKRRRAKTPHHHRVTSNGTLLHLVIDRTEK